MKKNESKKKRFTEGKIFEELPRRKRDEIARAMEHRVVAPLTIICRQGDPGDRFYVIRSGKVRVFRRDSDGFETEISVLEAGESFGEIALITGEAKLTNVEAMEETYLLVLSKEQFEPILRDFPSVSVALMKQMSEWILKSQNMVEEEVRQQRLAPRVSWFDFVLIVGVSVVLALLFNHSNPNGIPLFPKSPDRKMISGISAAQAREEIKKGDTLLVDAGPEGFYQRKHIQGAISVPLSLSDILYEVTFGGEEKAKRVIVYGGTFSKSYDWELADKLLHKGHKDVRVLEGGAAGWEKAGYPVEKWEEKK